MMTTHEMEMLLAAIGYRLTPEIRRAVMREIPGIYNKWIGFEVMRVTEVQSMHAHGGPDDRDRCYAFCLGVRCTKAAGHFKANADEHTFASNKMGPASYVCQLCPLPWGHEGPHR